MPAPVRLERFGKLGMLPELTPGRLGNPGVPRFGRLGRLFEPKLGRPLDIGALSAKLPPAPLVPALPEKEPPDPFGPLNVPDIPPPLVEADPWMEPPRPFGPLALELNEPPFGLKDD